MLSDSFGHWLFLALLLPDSYLDIEFEFSDQY
jgi:hypothetical protein